MAIALFTASQVLISKLARKHDLLFPQAWGLADLSQSPREIGKPTDTLQLIAEQNCAIGGDEQPFAPTVSTVN